MVAKVSHFETSDLPDKVKAALRIMTAMADYPKGVTDQLWEQAREFFTDRELADIVWYVAFCTGTKVKVTLGLDPGKGAVLYPANGPYKAQYTDDEIEQLRMEGFKVSADA